MHVQNQVCVSERGRAKVKSARVRDGLEQEQRKCVLKKSDLCGKKTLSAFHAPCVHARTCSRLSKILKLKLPSKNRIQK